MKLQKREEIIPESSFKKVKKKGMLIMYNPKSLKAEEFISHQEILETLASYNAEGRPIWKPMHMQPMYRMHEFVTCDGSGRCRTNAYIAGGCVDVGADIFTRGLCLPSDNKMTMEQVDVVCEIVRMCSE